MAKYILVGFCKTCGSPIFVKGQPVVGTGGSGQVIEFKGDPEAKRTCRCQG